MKRPKAETARDQNELVAGSFRKVLRTSCLGPRLIAGFTDTPESRVVKVKEENVDDVTYSMVKVKEEEVDILFRG